MGVTGYTEVSRKSSTHKRASSVPASDLEYTSKGSAYRTSYVTNGIEPDEEVTPMHSWRRDKQLMTGITSKLHNIEMMTVKPQLDEDIQYMTRHRASSVTPRQKAEERPRRPTALTYGGMRAEIFDSRERISTADVIAQAEAFLSRPAPGAAIQRRRTDPVPSSAGRRRECSVDVVSKSGKPVALERALPQYSSVGYGAISSLYGRADPVPVWTTPSPAVHTRAGEREHLEKMVYHAFGPACAAGYTKQDSWYPLQRGHSTTTEKTYGPSAASLNPSAEMAIRWARQRINQLEQDIGMNRDDETTRKYTSRAGTSYSGVSGIGSRPRTATASRGYQDIEDDLDTVTHYRSRTVNPYAQTEDASSSRVHSGDVRRHVRDRPSDTRLEGHRSRSELPDLHVQPGCKRPMSDTRRRVREVLCKSKKDPHYFDE